MLVGPPFLDADVDDGLRPAGKPDLRTMPATAAARRTLRFDSLQAALEDAERLAMGPHRTVGAWSLAEIVEHLARTLDGFYDGFGFQAPWWIRRLVGPLIIRRFLTKGMPSGFRLKGDSLALVPSSEVELHAAMEHFRRATARLERETPSHAHPGFGMMSHEDVRSLHLRHCELHLSFAHAETGGVKPAN
jgi:hypothetical protein